MVSYFGRGSRRGLGSGSASWATGDVGPADAVVVGVVLLGYCALHPFKSLLSNRGYRRPPMAPQMLS